mmetsp:Transcript_3585/g.12755  ORF Transcript_3585/g.12755 Transcript_3585/m.12755 type:complete len:208 (+) Transcript_3585:1575-2198(+)
MIVLVYQKCKLKCNTTTLSLQIHRFKCLFLRGFVRRVSRHVLFLSFHKVFLFRIRRVVAGVGSVVAGILRIVVAFRWFRRSPAYIRRMFLQFLHDFLFWTRDEIGYAPKLARGRDICARSRAHYRPRIVRVPLKIRDRVPVPRVREEKFIRRSFAETRLLRFVRISIIAFAAVVFGTSGGAVSIRFVVVVCRRGCFFVATIRSFLPR